MLALFEIRSIPGWLADDEARSLYDIARQLPDNATIAEIGSFAGKSTVCLAQGLKDGKKGTVLAIDPHEGHDGWQTTKNVYKLFLKNAEKFKSSIVPIKKTSAEAAKKVKQPIMLAFIDGNHHTEYVVEDINLWSAKLAPGGILILHDCLDASVWNGIQTALLHKTEFSRFRVRNTLFIATKKKRIMPEWTWRYQRILYLLRRALWRMRQ